MDTLKNLPLINYHHLKNYCQAKFVNQLLSPLFSYPTKLIVQSWNFLHFASQFTIEKNEHIILREDLTKKRIFLIKKRKEERSKMKWILNLKNNKNIDAFLYTDKKIWNVYETKIWMSWKIRDGVEKFEFTVRKFVLIWGRFNKYSLQL